LLWSPQQEDTPFLVASGWAETCSFVCVCVCRCRVLRGLKDGPFKGRLPKRDWYFCFPSTFPFWQLFLFLPLLPFLFSVSPGLPRRLSCLAMKFRRRSAAGLASGPLWLCLSAPWVAAGKALVRPWDELRVADVDPHRIETFRTVQNAQASLLDLVRVYFLGRDWLQLPGSSNLDNFASSSFVFVDVDGPSEWSARVIDDSPVALKVGHWCKCHFEGVASYVRDDDTAWLRLQFDDCSGCESGASKAAVLLPLEPDAEADSNLYSWMCAVGNHPVCADIQPTSTITTTELEVAHHNTTSKAPVPLIPPKDCEFGGRVGVDTSETKLGAGACLVGSAKVRKETHKTPSAQGCEVLCDLTYTAHAAGYADFADIQAHIEDINKADDVCKGFSFNKANESCVIHFGEIVGVNSDEDWECIGNVQAARFEYDSHYSDCTTATTTTTVTSTTSTVTTTSTITVTTTTRWVEFLSLAKLFAADISEAKVFGDPGETHFPVPGTEATLMQLQSKCFDNIDFYLLGKPLPVKASDWEKVVMLVTEFSDPGTWPSPDLDDCPTSVSVDRLPVDADYSDREGDIKLSSGGAWTLTLLLSTALGALGGLFSMCLKTLVLDRELLPQNVPRVGLAFGAVLVCIPTTIAFSHLASWLMSTLAMRKFQNGGAPDLFCAAPLLSDMALPCAITVGCGTFIKWIWPTSRQEQEPARPVAVAPADAPLYRLPEAVPLMRRAPREDYTPRNNSACLC